MAREDGTDGLVWFLVGAAVGASIALLYAPQSGRHTRQMIRRKAEEGRDKLSESSREAYEKGREMFEKGKEIADEAAELFERGRKLVRG
jgi:gas vesicle protein